MAVRHGYGKIAGTDALVFAYDTGDTRNSYKGEPTTNVALADMTAFTKDNGCTVTATGELFQGQPVYRVYFPAGTLPRIRFNFAYTTGQQWNGSIYYKVVQSGDYMPRFYFRESGFGSSYISTDLDSTEWTRANLNYTFSSNGTSMFLLYRSTSTSTLPVYIDFAMPQVELNSHATQYTAGTRSATQGLLDLTGNNTIDLSNVSFDSNAQITFDGTDDEINTGITTQLTDFSCEVVFKDSNSEAWGRLVDKAYTNGFFISSYFATYGVGYVGAGIIEPNPPHGQALPYDISKYNHFIVTRSGTTHTIYLNGPANSLSKTGSSAALGTAQMAIGAWYDTYNSQRYTGEIPVVKLYNRALTADEVRNNYRHYKNRFNIP